MRIDNNGTIIGKGEMWLDIWSGEYTGKGVISDGFTIKVNKFVDTVKEILAFDRIRGELSPNADITVYTYIGPIEITNDVTLPADLIQPGNVSIHVNEGATLTVNGDLSLSGFDDPDDWDDDIEAYWAKPDGDIIINGNLSTGDITLDKNVTVNGALTIPAGKTLTVNGFVTVNGALTVNGVLTGSGFVKADGLDGEGEIESAEDYTVLVSVNYRDITDEASLISALNAADTNRFSGNNHVRFIAVSDEGDIVITEKVTIPENMILTSSGANITITENGKLINNGVIQLSTTNTLTAVGNYSGNGIVRIMTYDGSDIESRLVGFDLINSQLLFSYEYPIGNRTLYEFGYMLVTENQEVIVGDANGDGVVNNKDVVNLFRLVSGEIDDSMITALDVNGDGSVNNKDVVALFKLVSSSN